jgi:hypothetical protein
MYSGTDRIQTQLLLDKLKEAGLPVSFRFGRTGVSWLQPGGPFEIWIEDARLLESPDTQRILQDAMQPLGFTPEEEEAIAAMPLRDEPTEIRMGVILAVFILGMALLFLIVWVFPTIWNKITDP